MAKGYRSGKVQRIGGLITFTDGSDLEYERMMQSVPCFGNNPKTVKQRDCPHCLHYCENQKVCKETHCIVFDE